MSTLDVMELVLDLSGMHGVMAKKVVRILQKMGPMSMKKSTPFSGFPYSFDTKSFPVLHLSSITFPLSLDTGNTHYGEKNIKSLKVT